MKLIENNSKINQSQLEETSFIDLIMFRDFLLSALIHIIIVVVFLQLIMPHYIASYKLVLENLNTKEISDLVFHLIPTNNRKPGELSIEDAKKLFPSK